MTTALGYKVFFGFGTETNWGVGTISSNFLELNTGAGGINITEDPLHTNAIRNVYRASDDFKQGYITATAEFSFDVRYSGAEKIFKYAMGTGATTGGTAGYTHTFTLTDELPGGMSFNQSEDLNAFRLEGGMINTMTLALSVGGFLTCSISVIGEDVGTQSAETISAPTDNLVVFNEGVVQYSGTTYNVQDFSVTLNNNLDGNRKFIGSRLSKQPLRNGKIEVSGSLTFEFEALTQYNNWRAATGTSLTLVCTGTGTNTLTITLPYIRLTAAMPKVNNEGRIMLPCNFKAYAQGSGTREMTLALSNLTSAI